MNCIRAFRFCAFLKDEEGQDLIEYTLLMAFIALASAAIFVNAGNSINAIWQSANTQLANAAAQAS
jgi:Flp pilus assembly pilin Flp